MDAFVGHKIYSSGSDYWCLKLTTLSEGDQ